MKKFSFIKSALLISACGVFVSCGSGSNPKSEDEDASESDSSSVEAIEVKEDNSVLDSRKCEEIILAHPFFKEVHVAVSDTKVPECEEAYAGCVKGGYISLSGPDRDAHWYYMYGFGIADLRDLFIEGSKATCLFDVVYENETVACEYFDERRIGDKMICQAYFTQYEDGWKLDGILPEDSYFSINVWAGSSVMYNVNFDFYIDM